MGEVKRVFHKKMWILIAVAVLGNLCLFCTAELAGRTLRKCFCGGTVSEACCAL